MNFEEDEFKDPDTINLADTDVDDGLDDEIFDEDTEATAPDLIATDDDDASDLTADL